ncbi:MAG TPA: hypothetical protein VHN12_15420 [Geobacteraceae bacterium]|nr:hypothetical protein [Geobacteraceae bacterium]
MKRAIKKLVIPDSEQVRTEATKTLVKELGIAKAALFIRDNLAQKTDYLSIKEHLFGKLTAAEIYTQIKGSPITGEK